jgi:hypothetical protein
LQIMDLANAAPGGAEDRLLSLARELSGMRHGSLARRESAGRIARGLAELSDLGRLCGQLRVARACKALSTILGRMDPDREDDLEFILSTSLNFLDAIQARRVATPGGNA